MIESRTYRIVGRVQGVGFRWFAWDAATREGLAGLRAQPAGRQRRGRRRRAIATRWTASSGRSRAGRRGARVDHVDRETGPATGRYQGSPSKDDCTMSQQRHAGRVPEEPHPARSRTFRSPASSSTTSRRCCATRRGSRPPIDQPVGAVRRGGHRHRRGHREPRVHPRRGGGRPARRGLLPDPQAGQAAGEDAARVVQPRVRHATRIEIHADAIAAGPARARSSTTCWRREGRRRRRPRW